MNTSYSSTQDRTARKDVLRAKRRYGFMYGAIAGLSFAIANWGMDAVVLSQAHALHPWLKVIIAIFTCIPVGGLTG